MSENRFKAHLEELNARQRAALNFFTVAFLLLVIVGPPYLMVSVMGPVKMWATYLIVGAAACWVLGLWICNRVGVFERVQETEEGNSSHEGNDE